MLEADDQNSRTKTEQNGFALLVVVWALALLAGIAVTFTGVVNTHIRLTQNAIDSAQAEALANGGVRLAALILSSQSTVRENTSTPVDANEKAQKCKFGEDGSLILIIGDEAGKVDLNTASTGLLNSLLEGIVADSQKAASLAAAITDFRDTNDLVSLNGAEARAYEQAGLLFGPKNAQFDSVQELEQVIGMSDTTYLKLLPFVTVHSKRNGIDPSVASSDLLQILSSASHRLNMNKTASLTKEGLMPSNVNIPVQYVIRSSRRHFQIIAAVETHSGGRFVREAVVELKRYSTPRFVFKEWARGEWPDFSGIGYLEVEDCGSYLSIR